MAEQQDDDIGREIIGLMSVSALAAMAAGGNWFQEAREQLALATGRAAAAQAQQQGRFERTWFAGRGRGLVGHAPCLGQLCPAGQSWRRLHRSFVRAKAC